jgi:glycyl-tRNA synthetase beta chain
MTALADLAQRAARLAKADLVTGLVGEFPELQGIIGGHLARAQSEPVEVADAIRDHYKPVGQGDEVPTAPVTVAVSLADKLDTLFSFFTVGMLPTGSKDPFALRRAALGYLRLVQANTVKLRVSYVAEQWAGQGGGTLGVRLADFFQDRLGVQLRESGVRYDFVQASGTWGGATDDRLDRVEARARALQGFVETPEGADLLAGYKRAANILRKEGWSQSVIPAKAGISGPEDAGVDGGQPATDSSNNPAEMPAFAGMTGLEQDENKALSYTPEKEEDALIAALDSAAPRAAAAVEAEDFEGAMAALASLRAPVDAFFDKVTVNDPDPAKRAARLDLLARMRDAVHRVADFSKIEG